MTPDDPASPLPDTTVTVRRTGGFAGMVRNGSLDPTSSEHGAEVLSLLSHVDLDALPAGAPEPDRYVYTFGVFGREVTVGEQDLPPQLSRVAELVLGDS
ncbi:MAG: protealysin inhibitor emfourin [Nocardioidaceae bacterium]